jgi:hypothetical protein
VEEKGFEGGMAVGHGHVKSKEFLHFYRFVPAFRADFFLSLGELIWT